MNHQVAAVIEREADGFLSLARNFMFPVGEDAVGRARDNLREAVDLFLECATLEKIHMRLHGEIFVASGQDVI